MFFAKYLVLVAISVVVVLPIFALPMPDTPYDKNMVQQYLTNLKDNDVNVRIRATHFFIAHQIPDVYEVLLDTLKNDPSPGVRGNLLLAIADYKNKTAIPVIIKLINDMHVTTVEDTVIFENAYFSLAAISGDEAWVAIENGLKSDDLRMKNSALRAFVVNKDVPRLYTYLSDKDLSTRIATIRLLRYVCSPEEIYHILKPLLAQKDDLDQYDALLFALSEIKGNLAIDDLIALLVDENSLIRTMAAKYLAEIRTDSVVNALTRTLTTDKEAKVRKQVVESLIIQRNPKAISAFIEALKDSSIGVRAGAAKALGMKVFIDNTAFQPLLAALDDEAGSVSANVAFSLGEYKDKDAIEPLSLALRNEYSLTRSNAVQSLYNIGGDETVDIIGKVVARELDHTVLRSMIAVMKKMADKEKAAKYIAVAINNAHKDEIALERSGISAYRQLTGNTLEIK